LLLQLIHLKLKFILNKECERKGLLTKSPLNPLRKMSDELIDENEKNYTKIADK